MLSSPKHLSDPYIQMKLYCTSNMHYQISTSLYIRTLKNNRPISWKSVDLCIGASLLSSWASEGFFPRGPREDFSKLFLVGPKMVTFDFSHSKLRNQPFFAKNFKIQGALAPFLMPMTSIFNLYHHVATCYSGRDFREEPGMVDCAASLLHH